MELTLKVFLIVCPLSFFAGFVDSIAGGGGLISLPAYLLAGVPTYHALGTNKLSSAFGTTISTIRYIKNKSVRLNLILPTVGLALIGSSLGANLVLLVQEIYLQYLLILILPLIAVLIFRKKDILEVGEDNLISPRKQFVISCLAAFLIGAYDGFYGPGTGTFLVLVFTGMAKLNVKEASGNAKCINLASNIAALTTFLIHGHVLIVLGLSGAVFNMIGNYVGSGLVLTNGARIVRPIILFVLAILFLKVIL
ncbi:MAG: sulfite exporter TauE/SafE family protein [Anaerocolumna sp.]|jgi:uncharacterized membrane protein YfcA|nr:sulfite exporter TauE/SafE family protein [Anaerocolumna sp.]